MTPYLAQAGLVSDPLSAEQRRLLEAIAPLAQERMIVLSDAVGLLGFLFTEDVEIEPAAADKQLGAGAGEVLDAATAALQALAEWTTAGHRDGPEGRARRGPGPQAPPGVRAGAGGDQRPHGVPAAVRVDGAAGPGADAVPAGRRPRGSDG